MASSGSVIIAGGMGGQGGLLVDVWRSDDEGSSWQRSIEVAPWSARVGHAAVAVGDRSLVLLGGLNAANSPLGDAWRSVDCGRSWDMLAAGSRMPWPARAWC